MANTVVADGQRPGRHDAHDYKRNGTTTLFAALNVLTGAVLGQCLPRHRHTEFLEFLKTIDRQTPEGLDIHLILDNCDAAATHKRPKVKAWLAKNPRFTPTSSSWLNLVERWFRDLTDKALRRGVFHTVPDLIIAIEAYLQANNDDPKPFIWTASAETILEKVRRGRVRPQTESTCRPPYTTLASPQSPLRHRQLLVDRDLASA